MTPQQQSEFFEHGSRLLGDFADLAMPAYAVTNFGLPETLKPSGHLGSGKFSLYLIINCLVREHGAGLHLKTAGTAWIEEVISLAESGGLGLNIAKEIHLEPLITGAPYPQKIIFGKKSKDDAKTSIGFLNRIV